jgi:hypothetical protein
LRVLSGPCGPFWVRFAAVFDQTSHLFAPTSEPKCYPGTLTLHLIISWYIQTIDTDEQRFWEDYLGHVGLDLRLALIKHHRIFLPQLLSQNATQGQPQHCSKACSAISSSLDTSRQWWTTKVLMWQLQSDQTLMVSA